MHRIGIIGTGRIANRFVAEASHVADVEAVSVYNPRFSSAESFANKHRLHACISLEEMFEEVDIVYIASVHNTHVDYVKKALVAKKHVLCEKPMAFSSEDAKSLYELADENEVILIEAVKTAFCPGFKKVLEIVDEGVIGEVKYIDAAFTKLEAKDGRELNDSQLGGSFTELGTYGMLPVLKLLGTKYDEVRFDSIKNDKGIDVFTKATLKNDKGIANVVCGLGVKSEGSLTIAGTKGYIKVEAPWWLTKNIEVHFEDPNKVLKYEESFLGDGLRYEIQAMLDAIDGKSKIKDFSKEESVALAGVMEKFLQERKGNF